MDKQRFNKSWLIQSHSLGMGGKEVWAKKG